MVQETFKRASENYKNFLDKESGEREREKTTSSSSYVLVNK